MTYTDHDMRPRVFPVQRRWAQGPTLVVRGSAPPGNQLQVCSRMQRFNVFAGECVLCEFERMCVKHAHMYDIISIRSSIMTAPRISRFDQLAFPSHQHACAGKSAYAKRRSE